MVCVYCLCHAPALLLLKIPGLAGHNARLLLYLGIRRPDERHSAIRVGQTDRQAQNRVAGEPEQNVGGICAGVLSATGIGAALWWATPFTPLQSAGMSFVICLLGFAGSLVMSAHQAGYRDQGLWSGDRGPGRYSGSRRLTVLRGADFLPPGPLLLRSMMLIAGGQDGRRNFIRDSMNLSASKTRITRWRSQLDDGEHTSLLRSADCPIDTLWVRVMAN